MKNFIHHDYPVLERIDSPNGRLYKTPNGDMYPSVTTVTGMLSKAAIDAWKKRIGEEKANEISKTASDRGTRIHGYCESFLLGEQFDVELYDADMWSDMKSIVDKIDNIHALESRLYSDKLKLAGTVDCIADYDGKLSVIDFKTSKKPKDINNIQHYFMQATAYSVMFEELYNIKVSNITIIIGVDNDYPQVFQQQRKHFILPLVELRNSFTG